MWIVLGFLLGLLVLATLFVPFFLPGLYSRMRRAETELAELRERLRRLEGTPPPPPQRWAPLLESIDAPEVSPPAPPPPAPPAAIETPVAAPEPAAVFVPRSIAAPESAPAPLRSTPRPFDAGNFEDLIGSVWFQNVGAVLILVGAFFLILWGYSTGRFGPGVLVGAGVAVGLAITWRGDRLVASLPRFGQALIGLGFGIVYLSLFLGHFTLRVLPAWAAFLALLATSLATLLAGLRHRAQTVAALGVIGAFLPQYLAGLLGLPGFSMSPGGMLAYLAAVNAVVFALAARAGWSGLDFSALLLSAALWVFQFGARQGSWPITIGLAGLFTAFGFAPLPRLIRVEGRVKPSDLAVIVVAPLAFVACAWPTLVYESRTEVAILLGLMAAAQLGAALWVDTRRPERDLWRPLTGSATIFLTAALQRAVGTEHTPMAWTLEGVLLVWLGLGAGGGWLRAWGYGITAAGTAWLIIALGLGGAHEWWTTVRDLTCIVAILFGAQRLYAGRSRLTAVEQIAPETWTGIGHFALLLWSAAQMRWLASVFEGPHGFWYPQPDLERPPGGLRESVLVSVFTGVAWLIQAAFLVLAGLRSGRRFLRIAGHVVAALAAIALGNEMLRRDGWGRDVLPLLHAPAFLTLLAIAGGVLITMRLARAEGASGSPVPAHRIWGSVLAALIMIWLAREADHVARMVVGVPGAASQLMRQPQGESLRQSGLLTFVFITAGWFLQAAVLMWIGLRGHPLLRILGHVVGAGVAITMAFILVDQQPWGSDSVPMIQLPALVTLLVLGGASAIAVRLGRAARPSPTEDPQVYHAWAGVIAVLLMLWLAREASHVARSVHGVSELSAGGPGARVRQAVMLGAVLTSVGWLIEAVIALVVGWIGNSRFLRWLGLGLAALTAIKFVLVDLASADPFWRFLTAIVLGSVLLMVSFMYQRRKRRNPQLPDESFGSHV